jgi:hypothetical protein
MRACSVMSILCQTEVVAESAARRRRRRIVIVVVVCLFFIRILAFCCSCWENMECLRFGEVVLVVGGCRACRARWTDARIAGLASRMCMRCRGALDHPVQGEA